jgi:biopolymer transport protein TolR
MGPSNGNGRKKIMADINVTPLVDVMLVLLIIFMVTAPMMTEGLNVDLPKVTAKALRQEEHPIIITIDKKGIISINKISQSRALMVEELKKLYSANKDQLIYLDADQQVPYGPVVEVMSDIKAVGFEKVGIRTEPPEKK